MMTQNAEMMFVENLLYIAMTLMIRYSQKKDLQIPGGLQVFFAYLFRA
jgi:hypothetical protein